jgi:hypothetical protein
VSHRSGRCSDRGGDDGRLHLAADIVAPRYQGPSRAPPAFFPLVPDPRCELQALALLRYDSVPPPQNIFLTCADESVSLFLVFRLAADAVDEPRLHAFLKEIVLNLEVAITDSPRQSDPTTKREKFEGTVVYAASIPETADRIIEQADGQWYVAWNVIVPISTRAAHDLQLTVKNTAVRGFPTRRSPSQQFFP